MYRRPPQSSDEVELNLAAMLDMAFQLLTFFILTFRPGPIEGKIAMHLPPPRPVEAGGTDPVGSTVTQGKVPAGLKTLVITISGDAQGRIRWLAVGETEVGTLGALDRKLRAIFTDPANPFTQVILQVGSDVRYDEVMRVIEVCSWQKFADGTPVSKLSFIELPSGG
jgi:biopolymer transport protein ExbD